MYSIDNPNSFKDVEKFRSNFLKELKPEDQEGFPFIVLANKIDLNKKEKEKHQESSDFVVSALKNHNIEKAFNEAAARAKQYQETNEALQMRKGSLMLKPQGYNG